MAKCRACGTINQLDGTHRAGAQLMKQLPKNMSEIDAGATGGNQATTTSTTEENKESKEKKVVEEAVDEGQVEEALALTSEEIGKRFIPTQIESMMNTFVTTTDNPCDYNWFCNTDALSH